MNTPPKSGYEKTGGMAYFPRMLDKIRLHAKGELRPDFHANLGRGADGWCTGFLRVNYADLKQRVLEGGTDEEILSWCFAKGRPLDNNDLMVWNSFVTKLGWNDLASPRLQKLKAESGLADRNEIVTMFDYFEADEGRKA
jgi:gluconokinase